MIKRIIIYLYRWQAAKDADAESAAIKAHLDKYRRMYPGLSDYQLIPKMNADYYQRIKSAKVS